MIEFLGILIILFVGLMAFSFIYILMNFRNTEKHRIQSLYTKEDLENDIIREELQRLKLINSTVDRVRYEVEAEQKKLDNEIFLEIKNGVIKKKLKIANPLKRILKKDQFIEGFDNYLGYSTAYSVDDIISFKHLIEKIKEKCIENEIDPYSIEPQDIVKCVYIIMSRAEIIAKKNQRLFLDFNFKKVFSTKPNVAFNKNDILLMHKELTYIYAKNELDNIINDEIRKFIKKFSS